MHSMQRLVAAGLVLLAALTVVFWPRAALAGPPAVYSVIEGQEAAAPGGELQRVLVLFGNRVSSLRDGRISKDGVELASSSASRAGATYPW